MLSGELHVEHAEGIRASHPAVHQSLFSVVHCLAPYSRATNSIAADWREQGGDSAADDQGMAASEVGDEH